MKKIVKHFIEKIRKEDKIHLAALFIIFLLAIYNRKFFLFQPVQYDEAFNFFSYVAKPLSKGISNYSEPNNHLFHTFLFHIVYLIFGNRLWAFRLPAFLAGILLVPSSYILIRRLYNRDAALLTAGLVASSSILIEYSVLARGYSLVCLFFLLIFIIGTNLVSSNHQSPITNLQNTQHSNIPIFHHSNALHKLPVTNHHSPIILTKWILFAILSALGFYTIPIFLYPYGIVVLWVFFSITFQGTRTNRKISLKNLFISIIITASLTLILYTPVFFNTGLGSVINNTYVKPHTFANFIKNFLPLLYAVWKLWNRDIPIAMSLFLAPGFIISIIFHKRLSFYRIPIILPVILWCTPVITIQRVLPPARVFMFLLPVFLGLASAGIIFLLKQIEFKIYNVKSILFALLAIGISLYLSSNVLMSKSVFYSNEAGSFRDAENMTIFLKSYLKGGDVVIADCPSNFPIMYYFYLHGVSFEPFWKDLKYARRYLIIVNKTNNQTLKKVLKNNNLQFKNHESIILILKYESADLYETERKMEGK